MLQMVPASSSREFFRAATGNRIPDLRHLRRDCPGCKGETEVDAGQAAESDEQVIPRKHCAADCVHSPAWTRIGLRELHSASKGAREDGPSIPAQDDPRQAHSGLIPAPVAAAR
jgi:hypothetical protein